jgi:hypothetical protein
MRPQFVWARPATEPPERSRPSRALVVNDRIVGEPQLLLGASYLFAQARNLQRQIPIAPRPLKGPLRGPGTFESVVCQAALRRGSVSSKAAPRGAAGR